MASEWPQQALDEVAELSGGFAFKSEDYSADGRFVLRTLNIKDDGSIRRDDAVFLPLEKCDLYERFELQEHDTLFVMVGATLGKVGYVRRETLPALLNQNMWRIRGRDGLCDKRYLQYAFRHTVVKNLGWASGSARDFVRRDDYRTMEIPVPPLAEQKAIAAVLGALDDKIELNRRMNATLEAMARALFQSWFVDFDPVRAKLDGREPVGLDQVIAALFSASFYESQLGHIPTDWDVLPLYDTAQWVNGAAFKNEDFCTAGEGLPVIKIAELKDGISAQTKWSQREVGADRIIDKGDLLYSWSGSPDTSLEAFLWCGGRGLLNQHIFKVISPTNAEKRFVYYLLQSLRPVLVETARNKQTTGLGHVTIADMKRLLVCMPSKAVLAAFDRIIAPIFDRAFSNTLESRTLATLRDTLLPKLLSGELSVADLQASGVFT